MKQQQSSSAVIRHEGRVLSVTSVQTKVEILAQTACAACHAKAVCGASNGESRVITIRREDDGKIRPEDRVNVVIRQGQGFKAVFIAYLIPLFILLVLLLTLPLFFENELVTGLGALGFVALYYLVLAQFRDRLNSGFVFTVEKINN
ncbi:MAG TPA: SoxR reducing system RseC family protein [Candidatus Coprenecus avistercoris]|uniref:SoxR reducing system RseC family protein n=1 Tax=Candidatus Coprenecus avistercoris TaxID=2840730 RepID=A0A9D1J7Q1_9BACT|nr:SoxR reducing system RseC family protein [Candidatus Coprenecus avistercoris]